MGRGAKDISVVFVVKYCMHAFALAMRASVGAIGRGLDCMASRHAQALKRGEGWDEGRASRMAATDPGGWQRRMAGPANRRAARGVCGHLWLRLHYPRFLQ